jgi:sporulation related protein
MADDNILRSYRSNDLARRVSAPTTSRDAPRDASRDASRDAQRDAGGGDPLAELARLIGQSDPFVDFDRNGGRASEPRPRADTAPSDWRKTAAALARESMRNPPAADPHFDEVDSAIAAAKSLRAPADDPFARLASHVSHQTFDQVTPDRAAFDHAAYDQAVVPRAGYADSPYDEPRVVSHADDQFDDSHHAAAPPDANESENYFFDGAPAPTEDRFYDDPPSRRATNGIVTAIVLIGCGILGTAGAYGYRTYYSGARPTDAPIISAEKSPSKMVPAAGGGDSQSGKSVERIGAANERVVARQEEPVTLSDPSGPRVVLPAPFTTTPGPAPLAQPSAAQPSAALPAGATAEPKKVRTVAIRPDGAADPMMVRPVGGAGSPPLQTGSAPANAATRQPPAPKPVSPPAHNGGGPLSLEPQGPIGESASSYQAAPQRPAPAPASAPRLASVAPAASAGGYVVQISSQRSEADAQASFRSLQSKFPSQLGDREAIVRRADLGPKGVYYRAMVGPFGSAGDADQFCGGLKAAGGQCIVQKN